MSDGKIVELMQVAYKDHDLAWLREALQAATELEFATLPPYLSALWSIKDSSDFVYNLILSVAMEEMLHMGLALNMLVAVGGTPDIVAPVYPGHLPGGVIPDLEVYLGGLTKDSAKMFMDIEMPEKPVGDGLLDETFVTIGAFYDAIAAAFKALSPPLTQKGQVQTTLSVPNPEGPDKPPLTEDLILITSVADAESAITTIKDQGEGVTGTPDAPGDELAHYYRFGEIYHGRKFVKVGDAWEYSGDPVPFPDCYPVARVPAGGYPGVTTAFDTKFGTMISQLQQTWTPGSSVGLDDAIGSMFGLKQAAGKLVKMALPGGGGNYGPDFIPIAPADAAPPATAPPETTTPAAVVGFKSDVLPLFTSVDIAHMAGMDVALDDYDYMKLPSNAADVYNRVKSGSMPPARSGGPWTADKVGVFKQWIDGGYQP